MACPFSVYPFSHLPVCLLTERKLQMQCGPGDKASSPLRCTVILLAPCHLPLAYLLEQLCDGLLTRLVSVRDDVSSGIAMARVLAFKEIS